jgi:hypothetical protein
MNVLDELKSHLKKVEDTILQSIANHNVLLGHKAGIETAIQLALTAATNPAAAIEEAAADVIGQVASSVSDAVAADETPAAA